MRTRTTDHNQLESVLPYWSRSLEELYSETGSSPAGLSTEIVATRRSARHSKFLSPLTEDVMLFFGQFKSPLQLILIFAVVLSMGLGELTNSLIIGAIVLLSGLLGFWQERKATRALRDLQALVTVTATVLRDGKTVEIPSTGVVRGDIVMLRAGDIIPGDCIIVESKDLHVNESTLTGESFPSEKESCVLSPDAPLNDRKNCVFQGTSVVSGTGAVMVIMAGAGTEYGKISATLEKHQPLTAFEEGIKRFGFMIMRITIFLALMILLINIYLGKPVTESILFALALAVGMAPELLPAIVTITLSAGATRMAGKKVIVKKLASIQNLGAVNIFCSDKTGTLTEGVVKVAGTVDGFGNDSPMVKTYAYLNAKFESGFANPLDAAIRNISGVDIDAYRKVDEVPYDFIRKRLSIAVAFQDNHLLITKGAVDNVLQACQTVKLATGEIVPLIQVNEQIHDVYKNYAAQGFRTIGLCCKDITNDPVISKEDETAMTFLGFIILSDTLKEGVADVIRELRDEGVALKVISGDNKLVAAFISSKIGLRSDNILTGSELKLISDEALPMKIKDVDVFAETEPSQKERLVRAFRKSGNVVAYIGDGINDVSALHAADVSISVDTAADVAKDTADMILLEKDLRVLREGIREGRKTFVNSLKYIFITTSANFGNMFSMAGTSLFLPFLPLLPKQILLLNLLSDLPAMAISSDNVDEELLAKPRKWNTELIQKFMFVFGIESSLFDFLTFGVLLFFFQSNVTYFQTGWFIESVFTEILILIVIRTQRPFMKSHPGRYLLYAVGVVAVLGVTMPYLPWSMLFGFSALPWPLMVGMICIAALYTLVAEFTKRYFFKKIRY